MTGFKRKATFPQLQLVAKTKRTKIVPKAAVKKAVLSLAETKTKTSVVTEQALINTNDPLYFDFPIIDSGSTVADRNGNKVVATGLRIRVCLHNNGTAVAQQMFVRMLLLRIDEGRYRLNADITSFFFEGQTDITLAGNITDLLREPNREGVTVMWDRVVPLGLNVVSTGIENVKYLEKDVKINHTMTFCDNLSANATNVRYALVCFARDGANDGSATTVEISASTRMDFKDM